MAKDFPQTCAHINAYQLDHINVAVDVTNNCGSPVKITNAIFLDNKIWRVYGVWTCVPPNITMHDRYAVRELGAYSYRIVRVQSCGSK